MTSQWQVTRPRDCLYPSRQWSVFRLQWSLHLLHPSQITGPRVFDSFLPSC